MKKLVIAAVALIASIAATYAQGQVNFNNKVASADPPIAARVLSAANGNAPAAAGFAAGLAVSDAGTLTYIPGSATTFKTTPATLTGYINPLVPTIAGHAAGTSVTLVMFGYAGGATDAAAAAALGGDRSVNFGMSNPVTVSLGGGTTLPPDMQGLQGFTIAAPEPSTIALGLLGAAALLIRRRK
jgi:hypothetical protein